MIEQLAAQLTPEIDRIALCVHRPSGRRPELREVVEELRLPASSIVASAARPLADGRVTVGDLELLHRYESRTLVGLNAQHHVDLGLLTVADDGAFVPSPPFRAAAALVLALQAEAAAELWAPRQDELATLAEVAREFVDAATRSAVVPTPAFDRQSALHHVVPRTVPGHLLGWITELRYLRADVHGAVLGQRGLAGPRARALTRLWKGHAVGDDEGPRLEERGLATRAGTGGWVLPPAARAMRDAVEKETDALFVTVLREVEEAEWERLLAGLRRLDGEDPRPLADR